MADLISNGGFEVDLTDWVVDGPPFQVWQIDYLGAETPGSAHFNIGDPPAPSSRLSQDLTTPVGDPQVWRLTFWARNTSTEANEEPNYRFRVRVSTAMGAILTEYPSPSQAHAWERFSYDAIAPADDTLYLRFDANVADDDWYLDDVSFVNVGLPANTCVELKWELAKRRRDWGMFLHFDARYGEVINRAISEAPRTLWLKDVDTSLTTIEETRRYSLAAITEITQTRQVKAVYIQDPVGHAYEIGRWRVEDALGVLTLVLDEDPPEADRTILVKYILPHEALDCTDDEDETTLDREWLLARAMTLLLLEADPMLEDAGYIERELQRWDAVRQAREAEAGFWRPAARKARSYAGARWGR